MSCMAWAIDYQLVIDFTDGTEVTFALSRQPVLSFADQNLCVSVEGESSQFELADVANFHFKEDPSAIRSPRTDNDLRIVWQGEDVIVIPLAASDTQIRLYGLVSMWTRTVRSFHFQVFPRASICSISTIEPSKSTANEETYTIGFVRPFMHISYRNSSGDYGFRDEGQHRS